MTASSATPNRRLPVVAVVGGIGSGKSSLAQFVGGRLPAEVVDADALGHEVLKRQDVKRRIQDRFGPEVLDSSGEILRPKLAERVFGEDPRPLRDLEAIVHPLIREAIRQQILAAESHAGVRAVLLDAAVLLESGWSDVCDDIVFVESSGETRWKRVQARGWTAQQLQQREARQLPIDEKRQRATFIVDNESDLESAGMQLLQFVAQRSDRFSEPGHRRTGSVEPLPPDTSESVAFRSEHKSSR